MSSFKMSATKITVTYKRKRGASQARAADCVALEPSPTVSGGKVAGSEALRHGADAENQVSNGDDSVRSPDLPLSLSLY